MCFVWQTEQTKETAAGSPDRQKEIDMERHRQMGREKDREQTEQRHRHTDLVNSSLRFKYVGLSFFNL